MSLLLESILVLSTAHVTEDTARAINKRFEWEGREQYESNVDEWVHNLTVYQHGEYGWLIHTGGDLRRNQRFIEEAPVALWGAIALAEANGCCWLLLDRDGPMIDALPTFEW